MRLQALTFLNVFLNKTIISGPVYEFGSMLVDKSQPHADLRPVFKDFEFIGTDIRPGPGVDLCLDLEKIDLPDNSVGFAVCIDTLEHVQRPFAALKELHRVIKPGGHILISSVMRFPIHDFPLDYWRFTPASFQLLLSKFSEQGVSYDGDAAFPVGVYGWGKK